MKHWKDTGVQIPDSARLVVRCNHKTNTVRAVIVTDKERKYAR